jgi:putative cardiolipin synthase
MSNAMILRAALPSFALLGAAALWGCAGHPPGADFPKSASTAIAHPEDTALGRKFAAQAREHADESAFHILNVGADGFRIRMQVIEAAQRSLDLQYYIFSGDETGRLLTDSLARAAERGVRIRLLIDDADTAPGDEQILRLLAYPSVELRIFNPFGYRGHVQLLRALDFLFHAPRLNYRMHNKLLVADNSLAIIGGRNIGNQYFQVDPDSQFADEDVVAVGPIVGQLSGIFDEFWNSDLAIPAQALGRAGRDSGPGAGKSASIDYASLLKTDEPFAGIASGKLPLTWAHVRVVHDSPDKKQVVEGEAPGRLITRAVIESAREVNSEILLITPFFVPAPDQLQALEELRRRQASVRILTNSLESNPQPAAQSGYDHFRVPLLKEGAKLYEVRPLLGNVRGSGQSAKVSRFGNYALHAKMYVFDRRKLFIGSMNYDQRSKHINTEIGLIIDSEALAQETGRRFDEMVKPENCYIPELRPAGVPGASPTLVWRTAEGGQLVEYTREPARSGWQRLKVKLLSILPLDREL